MARFGVLASVTCLVASGYGASNATAAPSPSSTHGTAGVAYAGSLTLLAGSVLGPKFEAATGDGFQGRGAGSTTLAQEILSKEISPGVFLAVGKKAIKMLWPTRSQFAIQLATDPLVVAYNPKGKYAAQFAAIAGHRQPLSSLYSLLNTSGLRIARTDPNADPQGVYFILMMGLAQKTLGLSFDPAATALGVSKVSPFGKTSQMVDEDSLIPDLQAGEFDASSAYLSQAIQYHLPYVALPPTLNFSAPSEDSHYGTVSITLTNGTVDQGDLITLNETLVLPSSPSAAPTPADQAADDAFASFLLSPSGRADLKNGGYTLFPPLFFGAAAGTTPSNALPKDLLAAFTAAGGTTSKG
jgi:molybdate/tungstate transport system substrate-binding protein